MHTFVKSICFVAITLAAHTSTAQSVYAWGFNGSGELGDGTTINRNTPQLVTGLSGVASLAAGNGHSMALLSGGTVRAWGSNVSGQLGNGTIVNSTSPVAVTGLSGVSSIAAGASASFAVRADGTARSWGYNGSGTLGNGTNVDSSTPVTVALTGIASMAGGNTHAMALRTDGTVWQWGHGSGNPSPIQVPGMTNVRSISGAISYSLASRADGTAWSWYTSMSPVQAAGLTNVVNVAAGGWEHNLAILSDGTVRAWGDNGNGQLGIGTTITSATAVVVPGLSGIVDVEAIRASSFALSSTGRLWSWGANQAGQLGLGDNLQRLVPTEILAPAGLRFTAIAGDGSGEHMLALLAPIPAPGPAVLLGLGGLAVLRRRR